MPNTVSDVSRPLPPFDQPPRRDEGAKRRDFHIKALMTLVAAAVVTGCSATHGSLTPNKASLSGGGLKQANNISRALPAASPTPFPADLAACASSGGTQAACQVLKKALAASKTPTSGLTPSQLRAAYGLAPMQSTPGDGVPPVKPTAPLVAIVAAYDDGAAEADLNTFRQYFGLPQCHHDGASGEQCFTKVQMKPTPGAPPPAPKPPGNSPDAVSWADEIALDLAMVSTACPDCRILLVEALGQDLDSLADAENLAASYHPVAISNSWGVTEGGGNVPNIDPDAQAAFNHPGIAITASTGDLGVGQVEFPASSPYVTAVGGTTLISDATTPRGWREVAWNGSGDGCSIMVARPSWQTGSSSCGGRSVPDVSMLADSTVGVAVFSSAEHGWIVLGGTSVGAPFVAGLYGAAADYGIGTIGAPALYANLGALNPVSGVANGSPNGLTGF